MSLNPEHIHYEFGVFCTPDNRDPCNNGYAIQLSENQYRKQLRNAGVPWICPICGGYAIWDEESE